MREKLNTKTIISKVAAYLFIIFFIFILPPPSITFLVFALCVAIPTMLLMVIALKRQSTKLYLIYHIGSFTIFFVFGLRFWDISIGISFKMLVCLLPGLLLASLFPYINLNLSDRIYVAQWEMGSRDLLLLGVIGMANIVFVVILWQLFGVTEVKKALFTFPVLLGFLFYVIQLMGMQSGVHSYASGYLQHWLDGSS